MVSCSFIIKLEKPKFKKWMLSKVFLSLTHSLISLFLVFKVKCVAIWNSGQVFHSSIYYLPTPHSPFMGCSGKKWGEPFKSFFFASWLSVKTLLVDGSGTDPLEEDGTFFQGSGVFVASWSLQCSVVTCSPCFSHHQVPGGFRAETSAAGSNSS